MWVEELPDHNGCVGSRWGGCLGVVGVLKLRRGWGGCWAEIGKFCGKRSVRVGGGPRSRGGVFRTCESYRAFGIEDGVIYLSTPGPRYYRSRDVPSQNEPHTGHVSGTVVEVPDDKCTGAVQRGGLQYRSAKGLSLSRDPDVNRVDQRTRPVTRRSPQRHGVSATPKTHTDRRPEQKARPACHTA